MTKDHDSMFDGCSFMDWIWTGQGRVERVGVLVERADEGCHRSCPCFMDWIWTGQGRVERVEGLVERADDG